MLLGGPNDQRAILSWIFKRKIARVTPVRFTLKRYRPSRSSGLDLTHGHNETARQQLPRFRDKSSQYIAGNADDADRRRKAMAALTAKIARVDHAVIKTGTECRLLMERPGTKVECPKVECPTLQAPRRRGRDL
jgi:hypothetical protein